MRRLVVTLAPLALVVVAGSTGGVSDATPAAAAPRATLPVSIPLPNGWRPEGIAVGKGPTFYVGSLADGAVFRGNLVTGAGRVLVAGTAGTAKTGLKVDARNRLWAASAGGGGANVYDAGSGALLASYQFTTDPNTFVNDLVVTPRAVYFTDSGLPFLYVVPLGPGGRLPGQAAVRALPLSGPAADADAFNNGIVATPTGQLFVVQTTPGRLVSVDPATGASELVDLGGYPVTNGDGLVLRGRTLYVVRNRLNIVAVLRFDHGFGTGRLVREITSPLLRVPATAALFGPFLYAANARFDVTPTPTTDYDVVRLPA
ncbi:MAG: superoxide dismutase [Mycobacteriales bacterium]